MTAAEVTIIIFLATAIGAGVRSWYGFQTKNATQDMQINQLQKDVDRLETELDGNFDRFEKLLEKIFDKLSEIEKELSNKENRK